jgi:hypothetical protein
MSKHNQRTILSQSVALASHGFGLRRNNKGPVSQWLQRFVEWMNDTVFK